MGSPPILVLASSLRSARLIAQADKGGDPPLHFATWEQFEAAHQDRTALSAVVFEADGPSRARRGLVEILRRAFPDAPLVSFNRRNDPAAAEPSPAVDVHLTGPLSADNLRSVIAREVRLRTLSRRLQQALGEVREQAEKLSLMIETAKAANSLLDPLLVMRVLMSRVRELIRAEIWSLHLLVEGSAGTAFDVVRGDRSDRLHSERTAETGGIAAWVVRNRRPALVADAATDPRCAFDPCGAAVDHASILCVPLSSRGRIIGAVELAGGEGGMGRFTEKDLDLVRMLMEPAAISIENAILFKKLEELSVTDDLTRLYNSRYLSTSLGREIKRAKRYGHPVSVMFLDIDGFKRINDTHGHLAGSRTLVEVGELLQSQFRESDIVSRYGGDEFTIVLVQTGPKEAMMLAERLRRTLEEHVFLGSMGLSVRITASFGVATFPEHGQTREDLIQQADQAMYRVKERGKNGVDLATGCPEPIATKT